MILTTISVLLISLVSSAAFATARHISLSIPDSRYPLQAPVDKCNFDLNTDEDFGMRFYPDPRIRKKPKGPDDFHAGVDLGVPAGTEYKSPADGIVRQAGEVNSRCGVIIEIEHPDQGICTHSCHMLPGGFPSHIKVGAKVSKGEVVAKTGQSGSAFGPHSHFVVKKACGDLGGATTEDPFEYIDKICGKDRVARKHDGKYYQAIEDRLEAKKAQYTKKRKPARRQGRR